MYDRHFTYIAKLEEKTSVTHISNHRENYISESKLANAGK
jgi:hypothetical protein